MKKIGLILFAVLRIVVTGTAQESEKYDRRENFTFGVKAGANLSNVWDSKGEDFDADAKLGFAGGVFVGIPIGRYIGVQPEVLFSQKGFRASGTLLGTSYSYKKTTNWIDIPLQFQIKPLAFLTILVGPQVSFRVSERNEYTFGNNSTAQEKEFKNDNIRKNMLGISTGFDINIYHVVVSGRASWDLQNNRGDGTSTTPRYRNQFVQLTIGFKI
ncbi:porin family protein [Fluviicola chungangensis]|uniref:PorT family protein n=1 Tax=Fluviicola chungangensis TaxID=2597671 RepID=A0A556MQA0_9FLAO|nr:porin family protein [Fluviicola chungangensis]TSJ42045.1 PorT family protein [Fluviicola chungangensis]